MSEWQNGTRAEADIKRRNAAKRHNGKEAVERHNRPHFDIDQKKPIIHKNFLFEFCIFKYFNNKNKDKC